MNDSQAPAYDNERAQWMQLFGECVDGTISEDGKVALSALLKSSQEARRLWFLFQDVDLGCAEWASRQEAAALASEAPRVGKPPAPPVRPLSTFRTFFTILATAVVLALLAVGWQMATQGPGGETAPSTKGDPAELPESPRGDKNGGRIATFMGPNQVDFLVHQALNKNEELFIQHIAPLLQQHCLQCHNSKRGRGGLDLSTLQGLQAGGLKGPVVVPGDADKSLLFQVVQGPSPKMPQKGDPLTREQVDSLRRWIVAGAAWPSEVTLELQVAKKQDNDWWSLRSLARPALPNVKKQDWVRTPIDQFTLAAMESKGLTPASAVDRVTFIRRATIDLHGLPPTPRRDRRLRQGSSPDAYERLVDRLLASPRYGERWARHWLDVVHYGDTHGYDKDKRRAQRLALSRLCHPRAQSATSPMHASSASRLPATCFSRTIRDGSIATGFIAAGPWDFVGQVELREGTVDKEKTRSLDRDDMVATTMSTFLSLTVHCARCHDHKFDPIPQKDYYRLQAVFAGVDRGDRPYDADPQIDRSAACCEAACRTLTRPACGSGKASGERALAELARARSGNCRSCKSSCDELPPMASSDAAARRTATTASIADAATSRNGCRSTSASRRHRRVRLVPARPTDYPDAPGLRLSGAISGRAFPTDPTFATADGPRRSHASRLSQPRRCAACESRSTAKKARYVRVTATRLWQRDGRLRLRPGRNAGRIGRQKPSLCGAPVTALDSIEAGRWSKKQPGRWLQQPRHGCPISTDAEMRRQQLQSRLDARLHERPTRLLQRRDAGWRRTAARRLERGGQAELAACHRGFAAHAPVRQQVYAVRTDQPAADLSAEARRRGSRKGTDGAPAGCPCVPVLDASISC